MAGQGKLAACFLALLCSCTCRGPIKVTYDKEPGYYYTGYVLADRRVVSVSHGKPKPGDTAYVHTLRGKIRCQIIEVFEGQLVLKTDKRLKHGDSGAAVVAECGCFLGSIYARRNPYLEPEPF